MRKKNQEKIFLQKSFNYLAQKDMNFYIMVICAFVTLIAFALFFLFGEKYKKEIY